MRSIRASNTERKSPGRTNKKAQPEGCASFSEPAVSYFFVSFAAAAATGLAVSGAAPALARL
ncbi:MAG: hypothetical protein KatS3mg123_0569 [Burkholderiales bacterium]|nr:MAG: hypothetical protein KatS3mg123_0569 [Burkholderiales bacterium]